MSVVLFSGLVQCKCVGGDTEVADRGFTACVSGHAASRGLGADRGFTLSGHAASHGAGTEVADRGFTFSGHAASHSSLGGTFFLYACLLRVRIGSVQVYWWWH